MKVKRYAWLLAAFGILLTAPAPRAASTSINLIVQQSGSVDNQTTFSTIQDALLQAQRDITNDPTVTVGISVKAGTYNGPIKAVNGVSISGESTQGTIIQGSGPLISLDSSVSSVTIKHFTFKNSPIGIAVTGATTVTIENNVFELGSTYTAIQVQNSASTSIVNNTFYLNGTAIDTSSAVLVSNNIFSNNTNPIPAAATLGQLSYNYYFSNTSVVPATDPHSIPNTTQTVAQDPHFVNASGEDFHLQSGSPARGIGNPSYPNVNSALSDMGAYGGPNADNSLSAVAGLSSSVTSPDSPPTTIALSWTATENGAVTGYRVYYGTSFRNYTGTAAGNSPISVSGQTSTTQTLTFNSLPPAPATPAAPVLSPLVSQNQALQLAWSPVPGATGYRIFHSVEGTPFPATFDSVDSGTASFDVSAPSFLLSGLTNGTKYQVAVQAVAQSRIFADVTAVINGSLAPSQGSANESSFTAGTSQGVGPVVVGPLSDVKADSPETVVPFPNLKNEGCFIATAAYGFYSAPQVQVLRDFRDRYLLTNAPGRGFVAWYYRYGPIGAHFINVHPWLKPPVRLALLPLVIAAFLLLHTPPAIKIALVLLAVTVSVLSLLRRQRKMLFHTGGMH